MGVVLSVVLSGGAEWCVLRWCGAECGAVVWCCVAVLSGGAECGAEWW